MFIGHYSISFAVKAAEKRIPLWLLFIAVQLVDVFWAIFVLLGIEKVRIVPGITASNPLDLYYMPYTHGLIASVVWFGIGMFVYKAIRPAGTWRPAFLVGLAVFSHWVLDFIVHRPDLPLYDDAYKVGLGLWNFPVTAFVLESGLLFGGIVLYLRATRPVVASGKYAMIVYGVIMLLVHANVFWGAPPTSATAAAIMAIIAYMVLAAVAYWLEKKRE